MELGKKKPLSLVELCVRTVIDNLRYVGSVDGVETELLKRILPHCTQEQLTRIESRTEVGNAMGFFFLLFPAVCVLVIRFRCLIRV
jgi:hypothetical protein